ncbi:MAG: hypothetical protein ABIF17_05180 [Patescibacteria group bacterium]
MEDLQKNILKTFVWFDLFEYPLKLEEIFYYLVSETRHSVLEIEKNIQELLEKQKIHKKDDFYFLHEREKIVYTRQERYTESLKKIKKARIAVHFLKNLPFIRAVFLCNVLGYFNAKKEDDIDFLIITEKNKIWTARWFATGFFKILNLRPKKNKIKDKFCFSFYLSEDGLNLEKIKLQDDPYLKYWFACLLPLYDNKNCLQDFLDSNLWAFKNMFYYKKIYEDKERMSFKFSLQSELVKNFLEKVFGFNLVESFFKKVQLAIMPKILRCQMNKSDGVVISNKILKMHVKDKRREFAEKFNSRVKNGHK